ncbi:hypothetical protein JWG39_10315 [Desulforhopalus vacuolatus]|uniref:hypothetical protein n=1 Tax=Desulforhopalus vacuolatus TaxID=40414 RepID=UPI0019666400|nr:hypothetical protein [Desulforhopalus vacuolatus]MBM9520207.1 hypothetical protein [Desulforhopalus vacuolatus]
MLIVFLLNSSSASYLVKNLHRALPVSILSHALKNVKRTVSGIFHLAEAFLPFFEVIDVVTKFEFFIDSCTVLERRNPEEPVLEGRSLP